MSRVQQRQFTGMQNRPNNVAFENKQKTWAGSSQAQQQLRYQPSR